MARFGEQVHVKGVLGGTEEAGRHVGYLTKYLTKSVGQAAGLTETATDRQREHARRLHAELQITPCSPRCAVWLLYGVQPQGARHSMTPGRCKARHTSPNTSASPAAASWSPARGPARPSTTTAPSAPPSFGNSSTTPASDPPTASRTAPTCGNDQHPARPTSHPGPRCSCTPSPNGSAGKPNTLPPNTRPPRHHPGCVRPLPRRRIDLTTGRVDVVPVPCGSTREDQCRPCAERPAGSGRCSAARAGTSRPNRSRNARSPPRSRPS